VKRAKAHKVRYLSTLRIGKAAARLSEGMARCELFGDAERMVCLAGAGRAVQYHLAFPAKYVINPFVQSVEPW